MAEEAYKPQDTLYLWWLGDPAQPRPVGELRLASGGRAVALQYDPAWLAAGFPLSEDLPLRPDLHVPREKDVAAGAVDDARPDRWGERVIRKFEKSPRLSILEYLLFAGDDRYGALSVSQNAQAYVPWPSAPMPGLASLQEIAEVVHKILANEPVPELQRRLIRPGVSMGGARPKSVVAIDGEPWLVKFSEGDELDMELIEHATMTLAARCGINAAPTRALELASGHAVAIRRFDRVGAQRLHAISANVALRAAGENLGYPELAQLLRRLAPAGEIAQHQQQLFRRMVFNILMDNTDDHEKNHALLRRNDGTYSLAPAFDVVPSCPRPWLPGLAGRRRRRRSQPAECALAITIVRHEAGQCACDRRGGRSRAGRMEGPLPSHGRGGPRHSGARAIPGRRKAGNAATGVRQRAAYA